MTKTEHIVEMMIEKAFEHIEKAKSHVYIQSVYNQEHRTIQLRLPRQTGQSTAIVAAVKKYFKNPLYVSNVESIKLFDLPNKNKLSYHQIIKNSDKHLRGKNFDCVVVDNTSFIKSSVGTGIDEITKDKNIETMSKLHDKFLFILIG
jgi:hypothetical protein